MIIPKTKEEIEIMRKAALMVSKTLGMLASEIKPGVTTKRLNDLSEQYIRDNGAIPGFLGLYDCPATLLASVNDHIVHGLPTDKPLQEGDIVSCDLGAIVEGFYGDHAYTFEVGEIDPAVKKLLDVTKESLYIGIRQYKVGNRVEDVGHAIQKFCEGHGYSVVRDLVGHGIGRTMHEEPQMPNYGRKGYGKKFIEGQVVAIEPMINMGTKNTKTLSDKWTIATRDGKPSAHFEHNVAIVDGKPELLSTFGYIYQALGITSNEEDEFRKNPLVL
ncbi:type I methionyl aminopeptidase [Capnocytophaga sp. ARDL2]|uniref:type I methionyl aminopeptidase n=1 Tax=Capnocytophaga sp. ARDL2 TaxID=3238809 RepID=UPI0035588BA7